MEIFVRKSRRLTICERNSSRDSATTEIQRTSRRAYPNKMRRSQSCANWPELLACLLTAGRASWLLGRASTSSTRTRSPAVWIGDRREAGHRAVDPDLAQLPCAVRHNEQHDSLLPRPRVHCIRMSSFLSTTSLSLSQSLAACCYREELRASTV